MARYARLAIGVRARLCGVALALSAAAGTGCMHWALPSYTPPHISMPTDYLPAAIPMVPTPVVLQNPLLVVGADRDVLWNQLVDVVDDYFKVDREERVRLIGDVQTEGRLETVPRPAATFLEPWEADSVTRHDRLEATLQSIRHYATVRIVPAEGGYLVEVTVVRELEDIPKPEILFASRFNLRNDDSLRRLSTPVGGEEPTVGWIAQGREAALEQKILAQLQARLASPPPQPF